MLRTVFLPLLLILAGCTTSEPDTILGTIDRDSDSQSDSQADSESTPPYTDTASTTDTATGDTNNLDSSGSTDSDPTDTATQTEDTDTGPLPFWISRGPKQLSLGQVVIDCSLDVLHTQDGEYWKCDEAPVPCIPDEEKVECNIVVKGEAGDTIYDGLMGIERRGRSSIQYNKPNYSFEFRNEDGSDNPAACMGMGKEADWILDGSWVDRSFIRNDLIFDIFSELGPKTHYGPDSRFVELRFNGKSQGIYRLVEKIKRDDDRINIPADNGTGETFIVKHDDDGAMFADFGLERNTWSVVYPTESKITETQYNAIQDWMQSLSEALNDGDAFTMLNIENIVDYVLMQELAKNIDGYQFSLYFFKEAGQLANMVPWDFDLSFGQPRVDGIESPSNESVEGWVAHQTNLSLRFLENEEFRAKMLERWALLRSEGPLSDSAIDTRIDDYLLVLTQKALSNNFSIWPIDDVQFEPIYSIYHLYDISSHEAEIEHLRNWIHDRMAWMDDNLSSCGLDDL